MNEPSINFINEKTKIDGDCSVVESKRRKSKIIVNTGKENIQATVKGIPKTVDFHIYI